MEVLLRQSCCSNSISSGLGRLALLPEQQQQQQQQVAWADCLGQLQRSQRISSSTRPGWQGAAAAVAAGLVDSYGYWVTSSGIQGAALPTAGVWVWLARLQQPAHKDVVLL
jgi:hypothetical protein